MYTKAIEHNPKYIYYRKRAEAKISIGDYRGAIDDANVAIQRYNKYGDGGSNEDGNGGSYTTLGDAYYELGDYQNAINNYKEALNWYDRWGKTEITYVDASGRPVGVPVKKLKASVYNQRGFIYYKLQKFNEAYADFTKAYELYLDEVYDRNRNHVASYIQ